MATAYLEPGDRVSVELVADSSGNVAAEGDLVEMSGETSAHTQVSVVETAGQGVAILDRQAEEYDSSATYAAGDVVGTAMVYLSHPVHWLPASDGETFAAGGYAVSDVGGGVRALDVDGTAPDDNDRNILGVVWATNQRGTEYGGDVAVVRHR